jgi:hypothetical protein
MPSAFPGGDDTAQAAGNPAFIHVMTGQKIEPEMISMWISSGRLLTLKMISVKQH